MVGHTGDLDATIVGCTAVDEAIRVLSSLSLLVLLEVLGSTVQSTYLCIQEDPGT